MSAFTEMFGQLVRRQQASGGEFRLGAGVVGHSTRVVIVAIVVIGALALFGLQRLLGSEEDSSR